MRRLTTVTTLAAALALPAGALAAPPTGGHGDATPQATNQYATTGPASAGLAYATSLDLELGGHPDGAILTGNGLAAYQGRAQTDLPSTPEDESGEESGRNVLVAVDPDDGSQAWLAPDIDVLCEPAVTSDGRIIAHLDGQSPTNPGFDKSLVAIDEDTGQLLPGQLYDGEVADDQRLEVCARRLLLSDDETLALVLGSFEFNLKIRAITIDPDADGAFAQAWEYDLRDVEDFDSPQRVETLVAADDGSGVYVVYRWDADTDLWRLVKLNWDGEVVDTVDLPGNANGSFSENTFVAADGGVAMALRGCAGNPNDTDECVVFYEDEGGELSQRWIAYEPDTGGNQFFTTLARADGDTLVGWSEIADGDDVSAIDVDTGAVEWSFETGFSNNGGQLITDAAGNAYFGTFGGEHLVSVSPAGNLRWQVPACHVGANEPDVLGPIAPDGTLMTLHADTDGIEIVRGFRTGQDLPKGECVEEQVRASGLGRVETAVDVSQRSFVADGSADTVVIATAFNYPDALAGGPLARSLDAPLLLTEPDQLSAATRDEIERLDATRAIVLGGTASVSRTVDTQLEDLGLAVERIAGESRFDTAARIAARVPATTVYVTEGANADPTRGWPDAVAVSGLASFEQRPILLVTRDVTPAETRDALVDLGATDAVVVGGTASVSAAVAGALADPDSDGTDDVDVTRVAGDSRFATSVAVAERSVAAGASTLDLWFATGLAFPDALAAGPAVARAGGVLLLVHGQDPGGGLPVYDWLESLDRDRTLRGTLVGGENAIVPAVADKLATAAGIG